MVYQLYIDTFLCLNFTMNLYALLLVNQYLNRPVTGLRIILGAVLYSMGSCLIFILPFGTLLLRLAIIGLLLFCGITFFVFRPYSIKAFIRILEILIIFTFLIGGLLYFVLNYVSVFKKYCFELCLLMAIGGIGFLFFQYILHREEKVRKKPCMAIISNQKGEMVTVSAIIDTGNCLKEPISGKPVSVLEKDVFDKLWEEKDFYGYRAIPFKSVGCEQGIMKGYEVPELIIDRDGIRKKCKNVYVGISKEPVSTRYHYRMLIHPALLYENQQ